MRIPTFITDVTDDRAGFRTLIAACVAIAAAGLDPKVLDPGMPDVRAALRAAPDLQSLILVGVVIGSALLIVGGVLGDMLRDARLLRTGLVLFVVSSALGVLLPSGPGLLLGRAIAWVAAGLVIPYAVGSVARAYDGATRATALGVVYAVMGAASAAAPALALALGVDGPRWPAFLACGVMSVIAMVVTRGRTPDLPGADRSQRPWQAVTGLWAFGVVALVAAILSIGRIDLVRIGVGCVGVGVIVVAVWLQRRLARDVAAVPVNLRAVVVVLAVGMVVGFAQVAPTLQLPMFFQFVEGFPPLLATVAIGPFVVALLLAGPISGMLLARFQPRLLIAAGLIAIGLANLSVSFVIARGAPYLVFVVPFVLVGAGFVIATTVRTAVIFASVPRGLPATAAALNEASLSVGSRLGITVVSLVATTVAIDAYRASITELSPDTVERAVAGFRQILELIGLPGFIQLVHGIDEAIRPDYDDAIVEGLRASHLLTGWVAVGTGVLAFIALGRRAPVRSVWDYADERAPTGVPAVHDGAPATDPGVGISDPPGPDDATASR
ncbi:MAG: MFS transporter [Chloroflexi bacterium]|nr:MFS transporter [Chloroflexota bacterium]